MKSCIISALVLSAICLSTRAQVLPDTRVLFTTAVTPFTSVTGINPQGQSPGVFSFVLSLRQDGRNIRFVSQRTSVSRLTAHFPDATLNADNSRASVTFSNTEEHGWVMQLDVFPNSRPRSRFQYVGRIIIRTESAGPHVTVPALYDWEAVKLVRAEQSDVAGTLFSVPISRAVDGPVDSARLRFI